MASVVCKKCGVRGDSKCPHCRIVFMDRIKNSIQGYALDGIEMRIACTEADDRIGTDGTRKHLVSFWTYAETRDQAMEKILRWLKEAINLLPDPLIKVAACDHEWVLMPGISSEIGCGHIGEEFEVPSDPFLEI